MRGSGIFSPDRKPGPSSRLWFGGKENWQKEKVIDCRKGGSKGRSGLKCIETCDGPAV